MIGLLGGILGGVLLELEEEWMGRGECLKKKWCFCSFSFFV